MFPELSLEGLEKQNATLVNNYNTLKKMIGAHENNTKQLKDSREAKLLLNECILKQLNSVPGTRRLAQSSSPVLMTELETKNAELETRISKFFHDLKDIEKLQRHFHQELNVSAAGEEKQEAAPHAIDAGGGAEAQEHNAKWQDLMQSVADVQKHKRQLEKLNGINETIIGKLSQEKDALQETVKQLEKDVQNRSPVSDRIAYFRMKKTDIETEKKKYQEELNFLLKERMEVENLEQDLHGQLSRMKDFSNYINLIKELEKQVDDLWDAVKMINHKKKKKQSSLCKEVQNFFLSESEIIKGNVEFLVREKREVKRKAENLEKELKLVEDILAVYGNIQETHQKELEDLREKMRNCEKSPEKTQPSGRGRFLSLFCFSKRQDLKEARKNKKQCSILRKQLEAVQQMLCTQGISAEKLRTKISALHQRAQTLDGNLLDLNSLTLKKKKKKISRLYF